MVYLFVRQTVSDYARWKEGFAIHAPTRQAGGATGEALVFRNVDAPHEITALLGWNDLAQARLFSASVSWQTGLHAMGVVDVPEVRFLEDMR
jgi:hypothetical protein